MPELLAMVTAGFAAYGVMMVAHCLFDRDERGRIFGVVYSFFSFPVRRQMLYAVRACGQQGWVSGTEAKTLGDALARRREYIGQLVHTIALELILQTPLLPIPDRLGDMLRVQMDRDFEIINLVTLRRVPAAVLAKHAKPEKLEIV